LNRRRIVRTLLASAATAAAIALAGCDAEMALTRSDLRAKQPLSPQIVAEIEHKDMSKESPVLVRIFKEEAELEVWKQKRDGRFALLKTYPICRWSGELGPKVKEGDRQAPEGFYTITPGQMNPLSNYYLAFNMGYPNAYDRALGRTGSQLMVHGDCSSRGCYAMTDEQIGEIYALAREAFFGGQRAFQVQAYPFRMTPVNMARHRANPNMRFWKMLKVGYDHFEVTRLEPKVDVCEKHYVFDAQAPAGSSTSPSFNPSGTCPTYEVPADILAAVREKQERDEVRTAELVGFTPVAPIKTGADGGMNPVYLAALNATPSNGSGAATANAPAATPHGTIPPTVNPPRAPTPVYASRDTVVESTKVILASAESRPEDQPASGSGFFGFVSRAIGNSATPTEEQPKALAGHPRAAPSRPAPSARQVASAPPPAQHRPTAVAAAAPAKSALRGTSASPDKPITTASTRSSARARTVTPPPTPVSSYSSPSTMTSLTGPVIRGARPALRTGTFENRWSALR
jgi:murein L,D-transpeptidase YafK